VQDSFLAVSGLLSNKRGGPAVYPPIPPQIDMTFDGVDWPVSTGEDAHRRGLYTFHQRTLLYPSLAVFDRPSAVVSVTGRPRSNTPLQALTTLHDPVFVEAARAFAMRAQTDMTGSLHDQVVYAFRLALGRSPTAAEASELELLHADTAAVFEQAPADAAAAVGDYQPAGVAPAVAAAWVSVARTILNLDKFITRD
jgi:Protein of unknown function (DUF1553)